MFKRFPYWGWLFISLLFWGIAAYRSYVNNHALQPREMTETMSKDLKRRQIAFDKLLNDKELVRKLFSTGELTDKEVSQLQGTPFYFYTYNDTTLHFWNNNAVIVDSVININGSDRILTLDRGVFINRVVNAPGLGSANKIAVLFPIVYYYPYENKYIRSAFAASPNIPLGTEINMQKRQGSYAIKGADNVVAFYAVFPPANLSNWTPDTPMLALLLLATIFSIVWLQLIAIHLSRKKGYTTGAATLISTVVSLRVLLYLAGLPFGLKNIPFFSPDLYASSSIHFSLGDLALNALSLFWIFTFILRHTPYQSAMDDLKQNLKGTMVILLTIILVGSTYLFVNIISSLVIDSKISFEVSHFDTTDIYTIIGLLVIANITALASIVIYVCNLYLNKIVGTKWIKYLLVALTAALFIFTQKDEHALFFTGLVVWLVCFIVLLDVRKLALRNDPLAPHMIFWAIFICAATTGVLQYFNHIKERDIRKGFAQKIIRQRDDVTEYAFGSIANDIQRDEIIKEFFRYPNPQLRKEVNERFDALYLTGQLSKYQARIYLFNDQGHPLFNKDTLNYDELARQKGSGMPVSEGLLYYKEYAQDGHYYLAELPIDDDRTGDRLGSIFIDLALKQTASETVYPELLQPSSIQNTPTEAAYSYAVYINKTLIAQSSDYPFPVYLRPYPRSAEFAFNEGDGISELWYKPSENMSVRIVHYHVTWIELITLFSYLFGLVMVMAIGIILYQLYVAYLLSPRIAKHKFRNMTLSRRIHFSMLALVFISFLIIGVVTVTFFNDQYNESNKTKLQATMQVIAQSIHDYLKQNNALDMDNISTIEMQGKFKYFVTGLAHNQKVDINVFDPRGFLKVTSQEDIYEKALLAKIIRPDAYYQLFLKFRSVWIQEESIGKLKYLSCYVPLRDEYGTSIGYINVPFFASEKNLRYQISNILVTLINLYAFIFLVSSILTVFLTRWLTRTFDVIIKQFSRINLQRNERIEWPYEDEIGTLVREYNKMVKKVEENAAILAQNERESAWREMARQVAHEIKNPLTPMKLNIQYLQQALRNDHPNARQLADKVTVSLIEQIDNLSYIASEFSNFAKMPEARPEELDLNELLDIAMELYLNEPNVKVSVSKVEERLIVFSDKSQLLRVFTNLLENAIQAIPEDRNGEIDVLLRKEDNNAMITITDNGQGIAAEVAERIFQPYFTTKSSGTGLGLAMTKKIIEFWQGQIWFETEEGEGTTFFIRLPIVTQPGTDNSSSDNE